MIEIVNYVSCIFVFDSNQFCIGFPVFLKNLNNHEVIAEPNPGFGSGSGSDFLRSPTNKKTASLKGDDLRHSPTFAK